MPPPSPFALPALHIGHDLVHIPRIRALLSKRRGAYLRPFVRRVLAPRERRELEGRFGPALFGGDGTEEMGRGLKDSGRDDARWDNLTAHLAGRFAAKEAVMKALPGRELSWHDIWVLAAGRGEQSHVDRRGELGEEKASTRLRAPVAIVTLRGRGGGREEVEEVERRVVRVSISHDGEFASAVALAWDDVPVLGEAEVLAGLEELDKGEGER